MDADLRGTPTVPETQDSPKVLKLVHALEEGSYGTVFLVYDPAKDCNYALKRVCVKEEPCTKSEDLVSEKDILCRLWGIPCFSQLIYSQITEQCGMFCLKYYPGGSLWRLIDTLGTTDLKLSYKDAQCFLADITTSVRKLHEKGVLHRDLNPGNILFDEHGRTVLCDFGVSAQMDKTKPIEEQITRDQFANLAPFCAPEMVGRHNYLCDFYSLGRIMDRLCADKNLAAEDWTPQNKDDLRHLGDWLTQTRPSDRPTMDQILGHRFFCDVPWEDFDCGTVEMPDYVKKAVVVKRPGEKGDTDVVVKRPGEKGDTDVVVKRPGEKGDTRVSKTRPDFKQSTTAARRMASRLRRMAIRRAVRRTVVRRTTIRRKTVG